LQLLLLGGMDYPDAAAELAIAPGLAYLIATGHAADGSHADNKTSTQALVNPPAHNPTSSETVHAWIRRRAHSDAQMQQAASEGDS
jgi:hypothetical protein